MKILKLIIRVSLLAIIVILAMIIIFPGIFDNRQIIFDEVRSRFMSNEDIHSLEKARRNNIDFEAQKAIDLKSRAQRLAITELNKERVALENSVTSALKSKDDQQLINVLSNANKELLPQGMLAQAISDNYTNGMEIINEHGFKCSSQKSDFREGSHIAKTYYMVKNEAFTALKFSKLETFEKWVELNCYKAYKNVEKELVNHFDLVKLTQNMSLTTQHTALWSSILSQSVAAKKYDLIDHLFEKGVTVSREIFIDLLMEKEARLITKVLNQRPNIIQEENLDQFVFDALMNSGSRLLLIAIPSNLVRLEKIEFKQKTELENAVNSRISKRVVWLFELDPSLDFSVINSADIDYAKLGITDLKHIPVLIHKGLNPLKLDGEGVYELFAATKAKEFEIVKLLVEKGVDINRMVGDDFLIDVAKKNNSEKGKAIQKFLVSKGAHNSLGKAVRKQTNIKYDSQCKVGKQTISQYGTKTEYKALVNRALSQGGSAANNYNICAISLIACTNDSNQSLDNCFESAPVCKTDNTKDWYSKDKLPETLCCPEDAKSRYNEMRCSGLEVLNSVSSLGGLGFIEKYGMPVFVMNIPEYRALEKERLNVD